jgi:hypothetical protein
VDPALGDSLRHVDDDTPYVTPRIVETSYSAVLLVPLLDLGRHAALPHVPLLSRFPE